MFDKFNLDDSDLPHLTAEVYEIIRNIKDPEFPNTLEELDVVDPDDVHLEINWKHKWVWLLLFGLQLR